MNKDSIMTLSCLPAKISILIQEEHRKVVLSSSNWEIRTTPLLEDLRATTMVLQDNQPDLISLK